MEQQFMMNDSRFPFYLTEGGKYVVYGGKVYRYSFVDYMHFKAEHDMPSLSPETMVAYLEHLQPVERDVEKLRRESEAYMAQRETECELVERRKRLVEQHRADYENACDDLYYGYGFRFWYEHGVKERLSKADARLLWSAAFEKMSKD